MAADGDRKDPPGGKSVPPDFLSDTDEDTWAAAIDEWDEGLDLPIDQADELPPPAPAPVTTGEVDPLVQFMDGGDVEIPEGEGLALGSLLGSAVPEPATDAPLTAETAEPAESIGISPDEVTSADVEVEVTTPEVVQEEPTPVALVSDDGSVAQEEPTPAGLAARPAQAAESLADLDLDGLMDGIDGLEEPLGAPVAPTEPEPTPKPVETPALTALHPDVEEPEEPPPLSVFDEIVPPVPEEEPEEEIEAGELMPRPTPMEEEEGLPRVIPDDLEQLELPEPELAPPPIPAELELQVGQIRLPERIEPVAPLDAYRDQLVDLLTFETERTDSTSRAAEMEMMVGGIFEERGDDDGAIAHFKEVLNHQPGHVPAMRALRRVYTRRGEPDQVAEILGELAERVGDKERTAIQATHAELLWSRTGDDTGARGLVDSGSRALRDLMIMADLAAATGDEEELTGVLEAMSQKLEDGATREALWVEQGRCLEVQGKPQEARSAYRKAGESPAAKEGLLRVCHQLDDADGVTEALMTSAVEAGRWRARRIRRAVRLAHHKKLTGIEPLAVLRDAEEMASDDSLVVEEMAEALRAGGEPAEALDAFARLAQVVPETNQRALALLEAGTLAEEALGDTERALDFYGRASDALPTSVAVQALAAQLKLGNAEPVLRLEALRALAGAGQGSHRSARHLAAALVLQRELEQDEEAMQELVEALEHDPANRVALSLLETLYRKNGTFDRLAAILDTAAEASDSPNESIELQMRSALINEGRLEDRSAAITRYQRALEQDAGLIAARLGLSRCLAAEGRSQELAESIAQEAMTSSSAEGAAALWTAHADLLAAEERGPEAGESYRMALEKAPGYPPAVLALTLLNAKFGRWADVAELWSSTIDGLPESSPRRRSLLMRLAALQEFGLRDPSTAVATYEAAAGEPHPAPGAMEGLIRSLRKAGQNDRLTTELERELALTSDPESRFAVLISTGELALQSGIDWSDAEKRFKRAMEQVPGHPVGRQALDRLYRSQMAWQQLSDLLMEDLQDSDTPTEERVHTYERLVSIDQQRGDDDSARLTCESIVELTPGHVGALRLLQRVHLAAERYDDAAHALHTDANHAENVADASSLHIELGRELANHPPGATEEGEQLAEAQAYRDASQRDPECIFALRRLVDGSILSGSDEDLASHYENLAHAVGDGKEAAIYLTRAGEMSADADLYRRALEMAPSYLGAAYRLRDTALRAEDWEAAYLASDAECSSAAFGDHRTTAGLLAGEIAQTKLDDPERAAAAFKQSLMDSPGNRVAFRQLRQFLEENERWEELVELLSNRSTVERSRARLVEIHQSLARLNRDQLGERDQAKQHLRILLKLNPEDRDALWDLTDLFETDEQWTEAANALIRLAKLDKDPEGLRALFLRLGRIYHDSAPDAKRAIVSFRKVVALDPDNKEALDRLSRLYIDELDFQRALATTNELLEKEPERDERVKLLLRAAKIHEDGLKNAHEAAIAYRHALEIVPTDLDAIGKVIGFFVRQGDQRSLMIHLDRSVATMRGLLRHNPLDAFAYQALFKIFGWRKAPDGCFCSAQALDALGRTGAEERGFLDSHVAGVGSPGSALGDPEHDELVFDRSIPGGFRQVFRILSDQFGKVYPGDVRTYGASRSDRIADVDHPIRRIGDSLAKDFGIGGYEVYLLKNKPTALVVENTNPPAILVGKALLHEATEAELQFIMGRSLWMASRAMILPAHLKRGELELLIAGIVRQYQPDYQPVEADLKQLQKKTKQAGKLIPRKLKQELMPFALECSGAALDLRALGAAVVHSSNRVGLLTCRSIFAALSVLCRTNGLLGLPADPEGRVEALSGHLEAGELLRFSVSDAYFDLRRAMHVAIH